MRNEQWAQQIVSQLIAHGADYFCCAPGSRSTPLALAIAAEISATYFVHFDERALAFHALGYAKASGKPAVILTTSGTAVGNLLPALMEASNERIPLIVLTADRPPELRDCGANQTCDQVKLFTPYIRWQADLPCPDDALPFRYLSSTIAACCAAAQFPLPGPVHLNCMFREPLIGTSPPPDGQWEHIVQQAGILHPTSSQIDIWADKLSSIARGVILCGSDHRDDSSAIHLLAEKLQWPIFADILSPVRRAGDHSHLIPHYELLLKTAGPENCEAILQFGNRFVSKALAQWVEKQEPAFYLRVSEHPQLQDPLHKNTHRLHADPALFCQAIAARLTPAPSHWIHLWKEQDAICKHHICDFFSTETHLSEPAIMQTIASSFTPSDALFLANSMPIRDANSLFRSPLPTGPIFGNRGVSGIDGNIATAAGIAQGSQRRTFALIGDLTFLHDMTSLAQLTKTDAPVLLIVINNGGGGIFSFLPVSKRECKRAFEEFIVCKHDYQFPAAAELFGLPYFCPESTAALERCLSAQTSCIIEIFTDREENFALHEQLTSKITCNR
ncbi:MAG: 2-succinyl-5-enolpyruvyl-6-hydroxy-3-cyclohexene-1-carboxylic-acid synthase [Chlamydiota bacterium]